MYILRKKLVCLFYINYFIVMEKYNYFRKELVHLFLLIFMVMERECTGKLASILGCS